MIRLEKPYLRKEENRVFLCAPITLEGKRQEAWFSTEPEYGRYLTDDRLDAFVVGFLIVFLLKNQTNCSFPGGRCARSRTRLQLLRQEQNRYGSLRRG